MYKDDFNKVFPKGPEEHELQTNSQSYTRERELNDSKAYKQKKKRTLIMV